MPRHADPTERREQVADALFRVIAHEGLQGASLPRIAQELGATTGLLQNYFSSKDELLVFAFERLKELVRSRVATALQKSSRDIPSQLTAAMAVLACADDDERDAEGRVWLAFLARAAVNDRLRALHVVGTQEVRDLCERALLAAQVEGYLAVGVEPHSTGVALTAFADGLAMQRALEPEMVSQGDARRMLHDYIHRLFTDPAEG